MNRRSSFGPQLLAGGLAFLLAIPTVSAPAAAQTLPTALAIVTVRGEGVTGRVRQRTVQEPIVRIVDENQIPVAGAAVVFTLPTEGATGAFGNGQKTLTIVTDHEGMAVAQGLRFNHIPGKVQVHVNASYKGLTARTNILQTSEAPAGYKPGNGGGKGKIVAILAILAAGGAGGAYYATHQKTSTPAATPTAPVGIGLTPGAPTIAPPR